MYPLLMAAGTVLLAHGLDAAATGLNKGVDVASSATMRGLLKRNESLTRWETLSIADVKEAFAICLEAGRHLWIFSSPLRRKSGKSLNYAT